MLRDRNNTILLLLGVVYALLVLYARKVKPRYCHLQLWSKMISGWELFLGLKKKTPMEFFFGFYMVKNEWKWDCGAEGVPVGVCDGGDLVTVVLCTWWRGVRKGVEVDEGSCRCRGVFVLLHLLEFYETTSYFHNVRP